MEQDKQVQRAQLLFEQQRFAEAEKEYSLLVARDPYNAHHFAMLALCHFQQDRKEEAEKFAKQAIGLEPAEAFYHYVLGKVYLEKDNYAGAEAQAKEAVSLSPYDADYHGLLSAIYLSQKQWQRALEKADEGLACDPENVTCLNLRTSALIKLNRKEDAYETIKETLDQDPNNAYTHANVGWSLLEKGEHKKSLVHFRQALMIDPGSEWARAGLVEALKARYWFYRLFLRYAFWIGNMQGKAQWAIIIGFYIGIRIIRWIAQSSPGLQPFLLPIIFLYVAFAITTWIIGPLSNLLLRLNVYGRYALDAEQLKSSTYVGISLGVGLLSGIIYAITSLNLLLMLAVLGCTLIIPLSSMFNARKAGSRNVLIFYAIGMLAIGLLAMGMAAAGGEMMNIFTMIYLLSFIAYQWVANALIMR
jgi:tetratricopeptide (TPR) repeat protein